MIWITTADHLDIKEVSNTKGWTVNYDNKIRCQHCGRVVWVWYTERK